MSLRQFRLLSDRAQGQMLRVSDKDRKLADDPHSRSRAYSCPQSSQCAVRTVLGNDALAPSCGLRREVHQEFGIQDPRQLVMREWPLAGSGTGPVGLVARRQVQGTPMPPAPGAGRLCRTDLVRSGGHDGVKVVERVSPQDTRPRLTLRGLGRLRL